MKSGIYKIENVANNKFYIGRSKNIDRRIKQHRTELRQQKHGNRYLQNSWDKYGEGNFLFTVIEYCDIQLLEEREIYWISEYKATDRNIGFNIKEENIEGKYSEEFKQHLSKLQKVNMLAYHERQRNNGKYSIRVYDLITGEYEIFNSTKECPYNFHKNPSFNFRIAKCKLDNNLTEEELQEQYLQIKNRYENSLISQSSSTTHKPFKKEIYSHQYSTIWKSDKETLYFKTNKEAANHFKCSLCYICVLVKKQKYKNYFIEKHITPQPSSPLSL